MDITIQNNWKDMFIGNITVFISGTAYYGNMCNPTFYVTNELSPDEFRALLPEECEKDQFDYTEIIPINSIVQKDADPTIIHHEIPKQSDNFFLAVFSMDVFYPLNRSAMGSFDANCYYDSNTYSIESEINERGLPMLYFITTRPCGEIGCPAGMVCGEMGVCIHGAGYVDILKYALLGVGVFLIVLEVWLWKRNEKPTGKSSKKNDQKTNLNKENKK